MIKIQPQQSQSSMKSGRREKSTAANFWHVALQKKESTESANRNGSNAEQMKYAFTEDESTIIQNPAVLTKNVQNGLPQTLKSTLEKEASVMGRKAEKAQPNETYLAPSFEPMQQATVSNDTVQRQVCHGTTRIGNLRYPGTSEHILIQ